ncbi:MAG: NAD-dependent epimerase/dehydratase family protein [Planctomycetota bacterium]|nr:NAD-dependent epimerase/dehydratase family protein [Planctomycetota bacterium]
MRVAVTGCSGYLAGQLIPHLLADEAISEVIGLDVLPPRLQPPGMSFLQRDIRDEHLGESLLELDIDVMAHLAFILNPTKDEAFMRSINVDGTRNILAACESSGIRRVLVTSSASAYGAREVNTSMLNEDTPLPAPEEIGFSYARHKIEQELICDEFRDSLEIIRARPVAVLGPNTDNFIQKMLTQPSLVTLRDFNPDMQFVHERDLGYALYCLFKNGESGAYNIAAPDTIKIHDIAEIIRRPLKRYPTKLLTRVTALLWRLGRAAVPAEYLPYIQYPWTVDTAKAEKAGFKARWSTVDALRQLNARTTDLVRSPADDK